MRIVGEIILGSFALVLAGCSNPSGYIRAVIPIENPVHQAPRGKYLSRNMALFSVNIEGQGWRFLLMPDEFHPDSPANYGNLYRTDELPRAFRELPRNATIVWRDGILNAWTYPPQALQQRVQSAAKSAYVHLQILPSLLCP